MRIYLDNCTFNRPYDDQMQLPIKLESEAVLYIQTLISEGSIEAVWSYILEFENRRNPYQDRRVEIKRWQEIAIVNVKPNQSIEIKANQFNQKGIKPLDALHLGCALHGDCDYFITVDKGILKKAQSVTEIKIISPIDFLDCLKEKDI